MDNIFYGYNSEYKFFVTFSFLFFSFLWPTQYTQKLTSGHDFFIWNTRLLTNWFHTPEDYWGLFGLVIYWIVPHCNVYINLEVISWFKEMISEITFYRILASSSWIHPLPEVCSDRSLLLTCMYASSTSIFHKSYFFQLQFIMLLFGPWFCNFLTHPMACISLQEFCTLFKCSLGVYSSHFYLLG